MFCAIIMWKKWVWGGAWHEVKLVMSRHRGGLMGYESYAQTLNQQVCVTTQPFLLTGRQLTRLKGAVHPITQVASLCWQTHADGKSNCQSMKRFSTMPKQLELGTCLKKHQEEKIIESVEVQTSRNDLQRHFKVGALWRGRRSSLRPRRHVSAPC